MMGKRKKQKFEYTAKLISEDDEYLYFSIPEIKFSLIIE